MENHSRQITYHSNKIQEPSRSTFRKRMGHLNGVLICDGLVGCCASPAKEKIVKRSQDAVFLYWFLYARNHYACTEYNYLCFWGTHGMGRFLGEKEYHIYYSHSINILYCTLKHRKLPGADSGFCARGVQIFACALMHAQNSDFSLIIHDYVTSLPLLASR